MVRPRLRVQKCVPAQRRAQGGFVLVSVLWVLVIMVLAASTFSLWVDKSREQAMERQHALEAKRRSTDLLAKILYTQLTGVKSADGVAWPGEATAVIGFDSLDDFLSGAAPRISAGAAGFMPLDGRVLDAGDGIRIAVQDRGGLIGLSFLERLDIFESISRFGGRRDIDATRLRDTLFDYQDTNDHRRPQGAEAPQYQLAGLPPPLNGFLRHPLGLRSILVWDELLQHQSDGWILRTFRTEGDGSVNVNTAAPSALELLLSDRAAVNAMLARRQQSAFTSVNQLYGLSGIHVEDPPFTIMPSAGIRFWWWRESDHTAQVYDVQFSPLNSGQGAWYFNWTIRVALPDDLANSTATAIDHPFFR